MSTRDEVERGKAEGHDSVGMKEPRAERACARRPLVTLIDSD